MKIKIQSSIFTLFFFGFSLFLITGCSSQTTIINQVPEREANEIVVLLASQGIHAEKIAATSTGIGGGNSEKMYDILVPSSEITEALAILNRGGYPRVKGQSLLDLFGTQGLVPSDMQDKIRYQEGLSEQLASTIRKMDGILDANVQITFPQEEEEDQPYTASVYVKHRGVLDNPNSLMVTKIKRLVSSALPGLTIENVSVITDRAIYADVSLDMPTQLEQQKLAYVWGIAIAEDSVKAFQTIFYLLLIFIFLLCSAVCWILWKCLPLMATRGGMKEFFVPKQYQKEEMEAEEEVEETSEIEEEE